MKYRVLTWFFTILTLAEIIYGTIFIANVGYALSDYSVATLILVLFILGLVFASLSNHFAGKIR